MKKQIQKLSLTLLSITLLAAACTSPLGTEVAGDGLFRSVNFGVDWEKLSKAEVVPTTDGKTPKVVASPLASTGVTFMKFAPDNLKRIYVGTLTAGLFMSQDGGDSWKPILSKFIPHSLAVDPTDSGHLYVSGKSGGRARLLESKDQGKSWKEIFQDAQTDNSVRGVAVNPANPKVLVLALLSGHIMRTTDGGETWNVVVNLQDDLKRMEWNPGGPLFVLGQNKGVFMSKDAGISFSQLNEKLLDRKALQAVYDSLNLKARSETKPVNLPSGEVGEFTGFATSVADPNLIYVATDRGLFVTFDQGLSWQFITLPLRQEKENSVGAVALSSKGGQIYASVGNVVYFSQNSGQSWQIGAIATKAIINYILVDPELPQQVFAGVVGAKY